MLQGGAYPFLFSEPKSARTATLTDPFAVISIIPVHEPVQPAVEDEVVVDFRVGDEICPGLFMEGGWEGNIVRARVVPNMRRCRKIIEAVTTSKGAVLLQPYRGVTYLGNFMSSGKAFARE